MFGQSFRYICRQGPGPQRSVSLPRRFASARACFTRIFQRARPPSRGPDPGDPHPHPHRVLTTEWRITPFQTHIHIGRLWWSGRQAPSPARVL